MNMAVKLPPPSILAGIAVHLRRQGGWGPGRLHGPLLYWSWRYTVTSERYRAVLLDVVLFVLLCIVTTLQFATRRGNRWIGVVCLAPLVMMLGVVLRETRLLPPAWWEASRLGLAVLGLLILFLGPVAIIIRHYRQPQ